MNSMKKQTDMTLKGELSMLVGAHMLLEKSGEGSGPKQKQCFWLVIEEKSDAVKALLHRNLDVRSMSQGKLKDAVKALLHRNRDVRSTSQGKLKVVKQEMARVIIDVLGISELKWTQNGQI